MSQSLFVAFLMFALVMFFTPGPNNIMLLSSGLTYGFRRTIPHIAGITVGFAFMVGAVGLGLGTIFIAILLLAAWQLLRGTLFASRPMLWTLMLAVPFPFIANTAGWITAEVGRQPWLIYGLMRTRAGFSPVVSAGSAWFTLLGFFEMYSVLAILFLLLVYREIERGPEPLPAEMVRVLPRLVVN